MMITPEQTEGTGTVVALQSWKKTPKLTELKQDLEDARPIHQTQVQKIDEYLDNLNVTGKARINTPKGNSKIVPRLIRKQAEWRYAALSEPFLSTDDVFNVKPVSWEDRDSAIQNEMVLNHQFNTKLDKVKFIDEYVRTAVDEGTIIVKIGWEAVEEDYWENVPTIELVIDPSFAPDLEQAVALMQASPSQFATDVPDEMKEAVRVSMENGAPYRPNITGYTEEKRTRMVVNRPTLEVCNYRNVVVDPTCMGDITKARFVVTTFESSLSDLRKDGKYKNLEHINVSGNSALSEPDHAASDGGANFNFNDQPRKKFVVHEYWGFWDIDGTGIVKPIVAAWVGQTMIRLEENPFPDKALPFVIVPYLPVRKSIYGEPDGALLEDNQKILGALTRGAIDIMGKSANGQTGMRKDMLDATNRRKFQNGEDYEFNPNVDPNQGVHMHTYPEIPMSVQVMLQMQNQEAESLTGVKSYSSGIGSNALGDVAAGIRGALDAASKRELGILRRLSQGMIEIGRKIISMNAEFLSDEEVVRVTNDEFVTVRRDDLAGYFDLRLTISTAEEDNNKAEQLAFMLQTIGPNSDPELGKMILSDICRLRKMPDLAHKIENFKPEPDPMEVKLRELEMAKLEFEVAELQAKTQKIRAEAGLTTEKINTEVAQQEKLRSEADQNALDFVEQESGVKQERDLQKQGEQARANMALEVVKARVKPKTTAAKK